MYYRQLENNSEAVEHMLLQGFAIYNPEFQEGFTSSSRECKDILVKNTIGLGKDYIGHKNDLLLQARRAHKNSINSIKNIKIVSEKASETLGEIISRDSISRVSYDMPPSINNKIRRDLFNGLVSSGMDYINKISCN